MLGHELRNPLAPIVTALQLMKLRGDGQLRARALEMIERQVQHLMRLVDDLLDVSRITRGKIELEEAPLRPARRRGARRVEMASPLIEQRAASPRRRRCPARARASTATKARLAQVVVEPADQRRQVHRRRAAASRRGAARRATRSCSACSDNGIGIAPRAAAARVRPVRAGRRPPIAREGGLGIGLDDRAQPRRAARRHASRAESEGVGQGQRVHRAAARPRTSAAAIEPPRAGAAGVAPRRRSGSSSSTTTKTRSSCSPRCCATLGPRGRDGARTGRARSRRLETFHARRRASSTSGCR